MIYLRSSKRTLKSYKTNSPVRKYPDNLMSYKIILRYGIGAYSKPKPIAVVIVYVLIAMHLTLSAEKSIG